MVGGRQEDGRTCHFWLFNLASGVLLLGLYQVTNALTSLLHHHSEFVGIATFQGVVDGFQFGLEIFNFLL